MGFSGEVRNRLLQLVRQYGAEIHDNPKKCEGLLRDYCSRYPKEINGIVVCLKERAVERLLHDTTDIHLLIPQLTKSINAKVGLEEELVKWSLETWALALGLNPANTQTEKSGGLTPTPQNVAPIPRVQNQSGQNARKQNPLLAITIIVVLLGIAGTGIFYFLSTRSYEVYGYIRDNHGNPVDRVELSFSNDPDTVVSDPGGFWQKDGLKNTVNIIPRKQDWEFWPVNQVVTKKTTNIVFTGTKKQPPVPSVSVYPTASVQPTTPMNSSPPGKPSVRPTPAVTTQPVVTAKKTFSSPAGLKPSSGNNAWKTESKNKSYQFQYNVSLEGRKALKITGEGSDMISLKYPAAPKAHWNLEEEEYLRFWVYAEDPGGISLKTVKLHTPGGYIVFASGDNWFGKGWSTVTVNLTGSNNWQKSTVGNTSFQDIDQIELELSVTGSNTVYVDQNVWVKQNDSKWRKM